MKYSWSALYLIALLSTAQTAPPAADRVILFTNSTRDLAEFRAFTSTAARMKPYGRVGIDIGVLAEKAHFELPPGGAEWHQYAVFNASLSKFFPYPKLAPFRPPEWVARNRELLLAKAAILREHGLEAALSSNDTHYLPEAFFERYPHLRGPRVDHPRRSRREEFSFCVDLPEALEMIEWMTAEARRRIPNLGAILVHVNDSGTGLCWADRQYSGPNGPQHCRRRGTGPRLAGLVEAMHRGAVHGGGDIDIRIGGMFSAAELEDIARHVRGRTWLSGRDPLLVGGHGGSDRDRTAIGTGTLALQTYPALGLMNPLGVLADTERLQDPQVRTLVLGTSLPWYYRADEPLETVERLIDTVIAGIESPGKEPLGGLAIRWGGKRNADRLVEAFQLVDEAVRLGSELGRYSSLYAGVSMRHITRPLLFRPEALTSPEESPFLPFVFNVSEAEARDDYIDQHGTRMSGFPDPDPSYDRFAAMASRAAVLLEDMPGAPQQAWMKRVAQSLRMWVSVLESVRNFVAAQRIRDARRKELRSAAPPHFKDSPDSGDPDYRLWYSILRRELDNTSGLVRLLREGGLAWFAHARRPQDEDTFLLGPNLVDTLERKRSLMREHWLDAQRFLAPPNP